MTNLDSILKSRDIIVNKGPSGQGYGFSNSHVWMWELDCEESWAPKNWCFWTVVLEKTLESPLDYREIQPVHPKGNQSWIFIRRICWSWNSNTLATWCEEATYLKRPWCWERLKEGGEGDDRGWDGWMASLTRWTWICVNTGSWWWTGRPGMLQFMGSQRVGHDWTTDLIWYTCETCTLQIINISITHKVSLGPFVMYYFHPLLGHWLSSPGNYCSVTTCEFAFLEFCINANIIYTNFCTCSLVPLCHI